MEPKLRFGLLAMALAAGLGSAACSGSADYPSQHGHAPALQRQVGHGGNQGTGEVTGSVAGTSGRRGFRRQRRHRRNGYRPGHGGNGRLDGRTVPAMPARRGPPGPARPEAEAAAARWARPAWRERPARVGRAEAERPGQRGLPGREPAGRSRPVRSRSSSGTTRSRTVTRPASARSRTSRCAKRRTTSSSTPRTPTRETSAKGPSDTTFDASVFTDANLDKYDVVLFLDTTGTTIDDSQKTARRQALQDFIEKKGRGFVGTHSATDTYQGGSWAWYVNFVGANFDHHSHAGHVRNCNSYFQSMSHPISDGGGDAESVEPHGGVVHVQEQARVHRRASSCCSPAMTPSITTERPTAWVHEMPVMAGATRGGRMFYTAFGHATSAFQEKAVMDLDHRRHQVGRLPHLTSRKRSR